MKDVRLIPHTRLALITGWTAVAVHFGALTSLLFVLLTKGQ